MASYDVAVVSENTRAADSDRNDTCELLDAALADGQLSTEEHRERVSAATKALTLGELQTLVSDLQNRKLPTQPPSRTSSNRTWGIRVAVGLAVVVLGAGIAWGLHPKPTSSAASAHPPAPPAAIVSVGDTAIAPTKPIAPAPPQMLTLTGLTELLAQMRTQFGDTLGYQLNVYQDKAVVQRPDTANAHKIVQWVYRNGTWANQGPSTAVFSGSGVGDLSRFDVQAVLGVVHEAPTTLALFDAPETFLAIESRKDGTLYLNIHVSDNTRRSGSIVVGPDGSIAEIDRPPR
ncbi:hypothetical protein MKUB_24060 [Mycobacterium kubicae]|uniref:DUF1707 domain-containing protein n=1 Tax=Mycobacterium kubicae TaxID=120959 RepID=A0ABQ1BMP3_9MYCO|nr:hypothetical protein AWC13_19085 [Mycobacterium kubicae]QNI11969.1 DUF1707 domain-containing protein [Mycobacterium kubicae]GFG64916.1 hypothetical protein MKUB_24060 [Mycobacterium kubicae]